MGSSLLFNHIYTFNLSASLISHIFFWFSVAIVVYFSRYFSTIYKILKSCVQVWDVGPPAQWIFQHSFSLVCEWILLSDKFFYLTCPYGQAEILEKYQYLFTIKIFVWIYGYSSGPTSWCKFLLSVALFTELPRRNIYPTIWEIVVKVQSQGFEHRSFRLHIVCNL